MKIEEKVRNTLPKMTSEARRIRVLGRPGNLKSVRVPVQLFARKHLYTFRSKKKRISKKSPQHQCVTGFPSLDVSDGGKTLNRKLNSTYRIPKFEIIK